MKALISIDYTYDFVADDGKLTAGKPAQAIEKAIAAKTQQAYEAGDYIFFAIDGHDEGDTFHPESRLFPPHNINGTAGRALYGRLGQVYEQIKQDAKVFWLDKRHYSAFAGTDLDIRLRERHVTELVLTGVLTDICVLHTAIDAYNLGYSLEIPKDCVASLTPENNQWALNHLQNVLGAVIK
ncbi:cysteine hydrolase family protein [Streptococcus sp. H31]|uniref:cysteine hydrolase family protein n=1 Tax=Streptococcus huangxiaojuni TaxID=3237239 RepID=UPI0034A57681